ncbi:MAG: hypothetical protein IT185_00140 [Acidobacteria bacterium]|nr:hypothetical protein [Acidobacteriota bacterium]
MNSSVYPCGCLVGVYQAWGGNTMSVIDLPHPRCTQAHRQGDVVDDVTTTSGATTAAERH